MNFLTNFAGPICIGSPHEKDMFQFIAILSIVVLVVTIVIYGIHVLVTKKSASRSVSVLWKNIFIASSVFLAAIVTVGYLTGSTEQTQGACKEGVWSGLEVQMIWTALFINLALFLMVPLMLLIDLVRLLIALKNKVLGS